MVEHAPAEPWGRGAGCFLCQTEEESIQTTEEDSRRLHCALTPVSLKYVNKGDSSVNAQRSRLSHC